MIDIEQTIPIQRGGDDLSVLPDGNGPSPDAVPDFGTIATILDTLAAGPGDLGPSQVATRVGLSQATTHRLLTTLLQHGYVEEGGQSGTYRLGLRLFQLGSTVQRRLNLRQCALPVMHELAEATEETVSVSVVQGDEALCVERVEGKHVQMLAMQVGTTLPLHAGAASRVLLASLPQARIDAILNRQLRPLTRFTEIQPGRLREIVAETRTRGFSISDEDVTLGVAAIGVPIRDTGDRVLGAISISGARQRLTRDRMPILVTQVTAAASRISRAMGHPG